MEDENHPCGEEAQARQRRQIDGGRGIVAQ